MVKATGVLKPIAIFKPENPQHAVVENQKWLIQKYRTTSISAPAYYLANDLFGETRLH